MIVKQDWLGPYNPVCAEMTVNEYYSYGTLYKTALLPYVVLANRTPPFFTQIYTKYREAACLPVFSS